MLAAIAVLSSCMLSDPPAAPAPAAIIGRVLDANDRPVAGVLVSVCDARTGVPVRRGTWAPFADDPGDVATALTELAAATTGADGTFRLVDVAPGPYRLLAQSWDAEPQPTGALSTNGRTVQVRGIAEVDVLPGETESVELLPIGTATLVLGDHAANDETLIMVSLGAPLADPIVGFFGWPGPFLQRLVAFNRMPDGVSTIRGLPAGDAHVVVFSADNVPGFGATRVTLDPAWPTFAQLPFVVTWSDGLHSPPPRLSALTATIAALDDAATHALMEDLLPRLGRGTGITELTRILPARLAEVTEPLPGVRASVADLLAAFGYARMQAELGARGRTPNPYRDAEVRPATLKEQIRDARR